MKKLSNYVEKIPYKNQIILFHKITGDIILVERKNIIKENENVYMFNGKDEDIRFLEENDFFLDDDIVQNYIVKNFSSSKKENEITIVISTTEECNLSCEYCYQKKWDKKEHILDKEYINLVMNYIKDIIYKNSFDRIIFNIDFIGGEPLIKKELINKFLEKILYLVRYKNDKKIEVRFHIDTNMVLLEREFILAFPNLTINTTITCQEDHNKLRTNSFDKVVKKLDELKEVFDNKRYRLVIRYNVHHENIGQIEKFIKELNRMNLKYTFDVQNIVNFPSNAFKNKLSDEEFEEIYIDKILPILLKNSLQPQILPSYGLGRKCLGYGKFNCKFYSNGQIVLCDAFPKTSKEESKQSLPVLPKMCIECFDFPYCGGVKPCDETTCLGEFRRKQVFLKRIICYVDTVIGKEE